MSASHVETDRVAKDKIERLLLGHLGPLLANRIY